LEAATGHVQAIDIRQKVNIIFAINHHVELAAAGLLYYNDCGIEGDRL
jgi:hypothetical protein